MSNRNYFVVVGRIKKDPMDRTLGNEDVVVKEYMGFDLNEANHKFVKMMTAKYLPTDTLSTIEIIDTLGPYCKIFSGKELADNG